MPVHLYIFNKENGPDDSSGGEFTILYHKNAFSLGHFLPKMALEMLLFSVIAFYSFLQLIIVYSFHRRKSF